MPHHDIRTNKIEVKNFFIRGRQVCSNEIGIFNTTEIVLKVVNAYLGVFQVQAGSPPKGMDLIFVTNPVSLVITALTPDG